jgi:hypothetical protein
MVDKASSNCGTLIGSGLPAIRILAWEAEPAGSVVCRGLDVSERTGNKRWRRGTHFSRLTGMKSKPSHWGQEPQADTLRRRGLLRLRAIRPRLGRAPAWSWQSAAGGCSPSSGRTKPVRRPLGRAKPLRKPARTGRTKPPALLMEIGGNEPTGAPAKKWQNEATEPTARDVTRQAGRPEAGAAPGIASGAAKLPAARPACIGRRTAGARRSPHVPQ